MIKIVTLCGMGWGCALLLKMTVTEILQKKDIEFEVEACDLGSVKSVKADIIVGTKDMERHLADEKYAKVILIENLTDKKEIEEKLLTAIKSLGKGFRDDF